MVQKSRHPSGDFGDSGRPGDLATQAACFPPNNRHNALLRVVAGLILLLVDKSGPRYRKNSSESDLNKLQLQNGIQYGIDRIGTQPESVGQNASLAQ